MSVLPMEDDETHAFLGPRTLHLRVIARSRSHVLTITTIASLLKVRRDLTAQEHAGTLRSPEQPPFRA